MWPLSLIPLILPVCKKSRRISPLTSSGQVRAANVVLECLFPYSIEMVTDQKRRLNKKITAVRISIHPNIGGSVSDVPLLVNTSKGGEWNRRNVGALGFEEVSMARENHQNGKQKIPVNQFQFLKMA